MSTLRDIHLSKETVYSRDMMMGGEEDYSDSEFVKTFACRNCSILIVPILQIAVFVMLT
jgi:hypothetical protein